MLKIDAIAFLAAKQSLPMSQELGWQALLHGELVPEGRAMRLQEASGGELQYDPKVYDEYRKAKRAGRLNNENHH